MKRKKKCRGCGDSFVANPRCKRGKINSQQHCTKPTCQKKSHQQSQEKYWMKDALYRERHRISARCWRKKNPDYWRRYRQTHPEMVKRNREQQRRRDKADLANTDTIPTLRREKLRRIGHLIHLANTDSIKVEKNLISQEILLFLMWKERLANTNSIARPSVDKSQSVP